MARKQLRVYLTSSASLLEQKCVLPLSKAGSSAFKLEEELDKPTIQSVVSSTSLRQLASVRNSGKKLTANLSQVPTGTVYRKNTLSGET